jgi:DNA-binding LytR/AlgR family response regulator
MFFLSALRAALEYRLQLTDSYEGYFVKPFSRYTLISAIDLSVMQLIQQAQSVISNNTGSILSNSILDKKRKVFHRIPIDEINYIEADQEYVNLFHHPFRRKPIR